MSVTRILAIINRSDEDFEYFNEQYSDQDGLVKSGEIKVLSYGNAQRVPWMGQRGWWSNDRCIKLISKNRTRVIWQWECRGVDRLRGANSREFRTCEATDAYILRGDSRVIEDWETNIVIREDYSIESRKIIFEEYLAVWAKQLNPLEADHTWVTGKRFCRTVTWGTGGDYCEKDRWVDFGLTPKPEMPWRLIQNSFGSTDLAKDLAKPEPGLSPFFPFISEGDVTYGMNGVCHTLTNRILYGTGLSARGALMYGLSHFLFGHYGTQVPITLLSASGIDPAELLRAQVWALSTWRRKVRLYTQKYREKLEATKHLKSLFLRSLDAHHLNLTLDLDTEAKDSLSLEKLMDFLILANDTQHREIMLKIVWHGRSIPVQQRDNLVRYAREIHQPPSMELLESLMDPQGNFSLVPDPNSSSSTLSFLDAKNIVDKINEGAKSINSEIYGIVGDHYETLYGHEYSADHLIINPDFIQEKLP